MKPIPTWHTAIGLTVAVCILLALVLLSFGFPWWVIALPLVIPALVCLSAAAGCLAIVFMFAVLSALYPDSTALHGNDQTKNQEPRTKN